MDNTRSRPKQTFNTTILLCLLYPKYTILYYYVPNARVTKSLPNYYVYSTLSTHNIECGKKKYSRSTLAIATSSKFIIKKNMITPLYPMYTLLYVPNAESRSSYLSECQKLEVSYKQLQPSVGPEPPMQSL